MTKKLLFAATAALAISSCTTQEVDDVATTPREPIRFESFVGKATRGGDVTATTLDRFLLLGKLYRANGTTGKIETIVQKAPDGNWVPDKELYWEKGTKYCFAATNSIRGYGFSEAFAFESETSDKFSLTCSKFSDSPVTIPVESWDVEYINYDLITAICPQAIEGRASGNDPISFDFKHALAKVQLTFVNESEVNNQFEIHAPYLEAKNEASFTQTNDGDINWNATTGVTFYDFGSITLTKFGESQTRSMFVLPQDVNNCNIRFEIGYIADGPHPFKPVRFTLPTDGVDKWEPGRVYNYKIAIKQAVVFGVEVEEWANEDETDLEDVEVGKN